MWIAVGVLYPITCLETCNVHSNTKGSFVRHPVASSVGAPGCSGRYSDGEGVNWGPYLFS